MGRILGEIMGRIIIQLMSLIYNPKYGGTPNSFALCIVCVCLRSFAFVCVCGGDHCMFYGFHCTSIAQPPPPLDSSRRTGYGVGAGENYSPNIGERKEEKIWIKPTRPGKNLAEYPTIRGHGSFSRSFSSSQPRKTTPSVFRARPGGKP
jgi:hypothetical protein